MSRPDGERRGGHCANGNHYDCSGHLGCHCECHAEPRSAAPAAEADLRAGIAAHLRYMRDRHAAFDGPIPVDDFADADDLIRSLPALQRLVEQAAEAARLRAAVARVRLYADLLDDDMRTLGYADGHPAAKAIRELLDGTDA